VDETGKTQPVEIDLERHRLLRVRWADGHVTELPLAVVRAACPCAQCRADREDQQRRRQSGGLPVLGAGQQAGNMAVAESAELVGAYALRIRWGDGHDTGLYDFGLLRRLDATANGAQDVS
jgi:DUF971 family protein